MYDVAAAAASLAHNATWMPDLTGDVRTRAIDLYTSLRATGHPRQECYAAVLADPSIIDCLRARREADAARREADAARRKTTIAAIARIRGIDGIAARCPGLHRAYTRTLITIDGVTATLAEWTPRRRDQASVREAVQRIARLRSTREDARRIIDHYARGAAMARVRAARCERARERDTAANRRAGAVRAAATRRANRMYAALPPAAQLACIEDVESECGRCAGHGLVYSARAGFWGRDVLCPECRGEGRHVARERANELVDIAYTAMMAGDDPVVAVAGMAHRTTEWDGTLTSTWERNGEIDSQQAARIREHVRARHEDTDYDTLLSRGVSRDDARAAIGE